MPSSSQPATAPDYALIRQRAYGPISISDQNVAERIFGSVLNQTHGRDLTREQVAAVLHALADYSLNQRMVSEQVADLAIAPLWNDEPYEPELAHGLGRWFHGAADMLAQPEYHGL